jgi:hypothetical protein
LAEKEAEFREAGEQMERRSGLAAGRGLARRAPAAAPPAKPGQAPADGAYYFGARFADEKARIDAWSLAGGQSVAQGGDIGEMFRYTIATPVKLQRSQSAMLPIVNESVEGEKVSIYNEASHVKHPLNGLRLKNTTELHLMQGPITVFDDGAYAGDAQIQDLQPGTERLISYAMDLDTEVAPTIKQQPAALLSVRISKGTLHVTHKHVRTKSYVVKNSGQQAKKVLLEQPIEPQWVLTSPKEPSEKTRSLYRFAVTAQPGKPATQDVTEEWTQGEQVAVTNLDDGRIGYFLAAPQVSEEVKQALGDVVNRKAKIAAVLAKRQELERQIAIIDQEQTRIRNNMAQLPKESDLFRRYVTKFTEQEDAVDALRKQVTGSIEEEQKLRKSLDDFLIGLELN